MLVFLIFCGMVGFSIWFVARGSAKKALSAPSTRSLPRSSKASTFWMPPGCPTVAAGFAIPDGMVYVGEHLPPLSSHRSDVEPALINPKLAVDRTRPDHTGSGMTYWPSYSAISPQCRAGYLTWLAGGRRDPACYIGYVFLFFYGLERRILDPNSPPPGRPELEAIARELAELLRVYSSNGSFRGYASSFYAVLRLRLGAESIWQTDPMELVAGQERQGLPMLLQVGIAQYAERSRPLPASWAFAWLLASPEAALRTPAHRAPSEFRRLFELRYGQRFGSGLVVPTNRSRLAFQYHPASASFGGNIPISTSQLSDASSARTPFNSLLKIAEECCTELEPYSRWLGRNPGRGDELAAIALLPKELAVRHESADARALFARCAQVLGGREWAECKTSALLESWPGKTPDKLSKPETIQLLQFLEKGGFGIEPDVRFGGTPLAPDSRLVIFSQPPDSPAAPSKSYLECALALRLEAEIMKTDGVVERSEEAHLMNRIASLRLDEGESRRLAAHVRWLLRSEASLSGLKKRLEVLKPQQRTMLADFLVHAAAADGHIAPEEIKVLTKIFAMLDLEASEVHRRIHAFATASEEPVPVALGEAQQAFRIPAAPKPAAVALDQQRIQAKLAESEQLVSLLDGIFAADEPTAPVTAASSGGGSIAGLDQQHSKLLTHLSGKPAWDRAELDDLARPLGLMPDGAIETINDAAFEKCGQPLLEGEERLEVVPEVLKEMLG